MSTLEEQIKAAAEKSILHIITTGGWIQPNYESRVKIPASLAQSVWDTIDLNALRAKLAARIESELVDRMVNHMAAELATDIKQILSVAERREALRAVARRHFDEIMKSGLTTDNTKETTR